MGIGSNVDETCGTGEGHVSGSAFGSTAESGFVPPPLITEEPQQPMVCPAGSVAFIHMDSWHGAGANILEGAKRYMLKFHYVRMEEPSVNGPSWDHDPSKRRWSPQTPDDVTPRASKATWDWLCGDGAAPPSTDEVEVEADDEEARDIGSLMAGMQGSETERVDSALALGSRAAEDPEVVPMLIKSLRESGDLAEEIATGWCGKPAAPGPSPGPSIHPSITLSRLH